MTVWKIILNSEDGWTEEQAKEARNTLNAIPPTLSLHGLKLARRRYVHRELGFKLGGRPNEVQLYIDDIREHPKDRERILAHAQYIRKLSRTSLWRIRKSTADLRPK